ncbi:MAG: TIR domain-containing protein [Anaerolineae bacterium]|jgi:WD40 repeat protein|nr:TIR domain-containing protein [Anaerolineae bacterium]
MTDIFISYSRKDKEFMRRLHQALCDQGRDVWADFEDIPLTADWWQEIAQGIEETNNFAFVISPDSIRSEVCQREVAHAVAHHKRVVPILYREITEAEDKARVPNVINAHNWLFFREGDDFNTALAALNKAIDTDLDHVKAHTRLQVRANEWHTKNQDGSLLLRGNDLTDAEAWLQAAPSKMPRPTELQTKFIFASERAKANRQRVIMASVSAALIVSLVLTVVAVIAMQLARQSLSEAQNLQSMFLADISRQRFEEGAVQPALLLALESFEFYDSGVYHVASQTALQKALDTPIREVAFLDHGGATVRSGVWSPDGTRLITMSADGTVIVRDRDGANALALTPHTASVDGALWNADQTEILTWSRDGYARVWNARDGALIHALQSDDRVLGATWNADQSAILTWSTDKTARIWDARTGTQLHRFQHGDWVESAMWSQDETRLLTAADDTQVRIWDINRGEVILRMDHEDWTTGAIWNADESRVLSWSYDGTARLWNGLDGTLIAALTHGGNNLSELGARVLGAAWNADESMILTWSYDGTAGVWDATDGTLIRRLEHQSALNGARWSRDGVVALTWSRDGVLRVWRFDRSNEPPITLDLEHAVYGADWTANERHLLIWTDDGTIHIYGDVFAETVEVIAKFRHDGPVRGIAWDQSESRLLTWSEDGTARLWDLSGVLITAPEVLGAAWNSTQDRILSWRADQQVYLDDQVIATHAQPVNGALWKPDETAILTWSADRTLGLWNLDGTAVLPPMRATVPVRGALWSADQTRVLAWGANRVLIWDLTANTMQSWAAQGMAIGATWSPDESAILVWRSNGVVGVIDAESRDERILYRFTKPVNGARWSADGSRILAWSADVWIRLLDSATGELIQSFEHDDSVMGALWSADQTQILSWSVDRTARIWTIGVEGEPISLTHDGPLNGATWNADETEILTWAIDETTRLWSADGTLRSEFSDTMPVIQAQWSADQQSILTLSGERDINTSAITLWSVDNSAQPTRRFEHPWGVIYGMRWGDTPTRILSWGENGHLRVWSTEIRDLLVAAQLFKTRELTPLEQSNAFLITRDEVQSQPLLAD